MATTQVTKIDEIRSYSMVNGCWEWNGDGWDAFQAENESVAECLKRHAKEGDWSAYEPGELVRLVGVAANGDYAGVFEFVANPA
jgi:hypothetical protein